MKIPNTKIRKYMGGVLTIKVRYEEPSTKCTVSYGLSSIDLPRHIDELRGWLRGINDLENTEKLYRIIEIEVNDMLREYQLEHDTGSLLVERFTFPTTLTIRQDIRQQINIQSGATPMLTASLGPTVRDYWVDRYTPSMEHLSPDEYEEKRKNGELESGTIYCVLN